MDYKASSEIKTTPGSVSPKMIAVAQRDIEMVKEPGMILEYYLWP